MVGQENNMEADFYEVQKFRQKLLWILLLFIDISAFIIFGYGMTKQLIFGIKWGTHPMSDIGLAIVGSIIIVFLGLLTYIFYSLKLIIEVRDEGLLINFYPLTQEKISYENIKKCKVRRYSPIKEYGGWGIRYGRKGKAYNVSGNLGVQLSLTNGKSLLIGSQKPEELLHAIQMKMKR